MDYFKAISALRVLVTLQSNMGEMLSHIYVCAKKIKINPLHLLGQFKFYRVVKKIVTGIDLTWNLNLSST